DLAMERLAFGEAAQQFDRALEQHVLAGSARPERHCEVLLRVASAHSASGQYAQARDSYIECGRVAQRHGLGPWLVAAALGLTNPRQSRVEVGADEMDLLVAAYEMSAPDDSATRSMLAARRAGLLREGSEERRDWSNQALALARTSGDDRAMQLALAEQVSNLF